MARADCQNEGEVYLDHNATYPIRDAALNAMESVVYTSGNPSSTHGLGQEARRRIDAVRDLLTKLLDAPGHVPVFTSGGTESNHLALEGLARLGAASGRRRIVVLEGDHPALLQPASRLAEQHGFECSFCRLRSDGRADLGHLAELLDAETALVAVAWAHNETGVIQPMAEIRGLTDAHDIPIHADAVQAVGKWHVSVKETGVTTVSLSAHKFGGPRGVGALLTRADTELPPLWQGGGQERGVRSGSVPEVLVHGMGAALTESLGELPEVTKRWAALRAQFEARLFTLGSVGIAGADTARLPNTAMCLFSGQTNLVDRFDQAGVRVSAGAACHSDGATASGVLAAMGFSASSMQGAVRFSLGSKTQAADLDRVVEIVERWKSDNE